MTAARPLPAAPVGYPVDHQTTLDGRPATVRMWVDTTHEDAPVPLVEEVTVCGVTISSPRDVFLPGLLADWEAECADRELGIIHPHATEAA